jgi:hypothetical protein
MRGVDELVMGNGVRYISQTYPPYSVLIACCFNPMGEVTRVSQGRFYR